MERRVRDCKRDTTTRELLLLTSYATTYENELKLVAINASDDN